MDLRHYTENQLSRWSEKERENGRKGKVKGRSREREGKQKQSDEDRKTEQQPITRKEEPALPGSGHGKARNHSHFKLEKQQLMRGFLDSGHHWVQTYHLEGCKFASEMKLPTAAEEINNTSS